MKKVRNQSSDHYIALYQRWKNSNLPVSTFCEQESIKYATFRYWIKKFEQPSVVAVVFTELKMETSGASLASTPVGVVRFATGTTLSLYELPDPLWLKALL
jgi:hypothetical protein